MIDADGKKDKDTMKNVNPHQEKETPVHGEASAPEKADKLQIKTDPKKPLSDSLKEMFVQVTEKGEKIMKSGAAAVGDFTAHAAHQAKLKIEIHNLRNNLEKRYQEAGEKLWRLHKQGELDDIEAAFSDHFKRMALIEETLEEKEAEMESKEEVLAEEEK